MSKELEQNEKQLIEEKHEETEFINDENSLIRKGCEPLNAQICICEK
jgi:hypothetical protein